MIKNKRKNPTDFKKLKLGVSSGIKAQDDLSIDLHKFVQKMKEKHDNLLDTIGFYLSDENEAKFINLLIKIDKFADELQLF